MPWLSICLAILSFLLAGGDKKENRAKAAAIALGVGAATYGVTHYTDWGSENLGQLDGVTTVGAGLATKAIDADGKEITPAPSAANTSNTGGLWQKLSAWTTDNLGGLAAGAAIGGLPSWALLAGAGLVLYLVTK